MRFRGTVVTVAVGLVLAGCSNAPAVLGGNITVHGFVQQEQSQSSSGDCDSGELHAGNKVVLKEGTGSQAGVSELETPEYQGNTSDEDGICTFKFAIADVHPTGGGYTIEVNPPFGLESVFSADE